MVPMTKRPSNIATMPLSATDKALPLRPPARSCSQRLTRRSSRRRIRPVERHAVPDGCLKSIDVDSREALELDAITRDAGLPDRGAVGALQIVLVLEAEHIHRDACGVRAQADAVELARRPIGVRDGVDAVPDVGV